MLLAEDDLALSAMQRSPGADAPLQSAPDAGTDLGMAPSDLVEDGDLAVARRVVSGGINQLDKFTSIYNKVLAQL